MLVLHCLACGDVRRLVGEVRRCACERSFGNLHGDVPSIAGPARVLMLGDASVSSGWWTEALEGAAVTRVPLGPLL